MVKGLRSLARNRLITQPKGLMLSKGNATLQQNKKRGDKFSSLLLMLRGQFYSALASSAGAAASAAFFERPRRVVFFLSA